MYRKLLPLFVLSSALLFGCQASPQTAESTKSPAETTKSTSSTDGFTTETEKTPETSSPVASTTESSTPKTTSMTPEQAKTAQLAAPQRGDTVATIETSLGTIQIKLFVTEVPEITKNFIELSKSGKYEGAPFHRVIQDFMIQTGDFERKNGTGGYTYLGPNTALDDQFSKNLKHYQYTVSMANSGPDTNGSQFFVVSAPDGTSWLDGKHSVFGQVYEGQSVVDKIGSAQTDSSDRPLKPISIIKITISTF